MRRLISLPLAALATSLTVGAQQTARPMNFLDVQLMRQVGSPAISPNGQWMLYTLSVPNWAEARRNTDVYVVSTERGLASTRQLTFTKDKNETTPRWAPDGSWFAFSSNREGTTQQLYMMRPDGGEAQKITDARDGVGNFAFGGSRLFFSAGKDGEQQIWTLPVADVDTARAQQLTKHTTPVGQWQLSRDGTRLFFLAPDSIDSDNKARMEKKFDVRIRNEDRPLNHLWVVDVATGTERRLTGDSTFSVEGFSLSSDGRWAGLRAQPNNRYVRTVTEANNFGDLHLLDLQNGKAERLTSNQNISESNLSFAPDGRTIAFSASDDFVYFRANKVYTRAISDVGGRWTKLGGSHDGDVTIGWWSPDSRSIHYTDGVRATTQLMRLDIAANTVSQVTNFRATTNASWDETSRKYLITYSDPKTPAVHFVADNVADIADKTRWRQLTDANPQARQWALGDAEEICWASKDRKNTCGILVKPAGYQPGNRYPLIVAIHGGPQSADVLGFNGGYGSQIYAGDGYAVLLPNYRGSTNYGEEHKWGIVNDYFRKGYEDIITGVDKLIADGIVDGSKLGALGWSAGGHWSNWILVSTDRFKAISSGAGTSNWISMYAQSDMQDVRMHYLGNKLPYEDFEPYWKQSPIRYIKNAKTPTMIHVVDGDPRVPRPQSEELHMALRKLGVPTELFVYPGQTHGIPDARNQLLKSVSEKAWMDKWILGKGGFRWQDVLKTLEAGAGTRAVTTTSGSM
ncbi:MAG: prolyl oligopeptidase family serine peptidase [Gemmatimonadota bacterium]